MHHSRKRGAHLSVGQSLGQRAVPCHHGQGLHGGHAVRDGAAEHGERAFGRNHAFEHDAELACAFQRAVVVLPVVYACVAAAFLHGAEGFEIHGVEHVAAVVVEREVGAVGVPSVAHVPFLHLAYGRVHAIFVTFGAGLGKQALDGGREQKPVGIGRVDAAQLAELLDVALLGDTVERQPQGVVGAQERPGHVGGVHESLAVAAPQQIVGACGVDGIGVALQRPLAQLLALASFGGVVVGQGEPRRNAGHEPAEGLHVRHFFVAAVPVGAHLHEHFFLQPAFCHTAQHGRSHGVGQVHPVCAVVAAVFLKIAHILAGSEQESARAEIRHRCLVHHLAGNGLFAYRLHVAHGSVFLQGYAREVVPAFLCGVCVSRVFQIAVVYAPQQAVSEECRSACLIAGSMGLVHHRAAPVAFGALQAHNGVGHAHELVLEKRAMSIVGRNVLQHLGQPGQHPAVAACPEILFAVGAFVLGIHIFAVAVVQTLAGIVHYAVAHKHIFVEFVEIGGVAREPVHFCHHRHHHIEAVGPPPVIAARRRHLILHHLLRTGYAAVVGKDAVQVGVGLEAYLPVAEKHMVVGLAVVVAPFRAVVSLGALPFVVLGPSLRIVEPRFVAGEEIGLHIARVVGGVVPESACLRRIGGLPVVVHFFDYVAHASRLLCRGGIQRHCRRARRQDGYDGKSFHGL